MTPLRRRMIEDMKLRNLAPRTIKVYVARVATFARHFGTSPEALGPDDVRAYLLHLVQEKHVSWSVYNQTVAALRFLYEVTLGRDGVLRAHRLPQAAQEAPRRPQPRRGRPVLRGHRRPQAPRHPHDRLRRRAADLRGRRPARRRHRQPAHGHPRPPGQGPQGPLRDALAAAAGPAPRVLEGRPADRLALPRRRPGPAHHRRHGAPGLRPGRPRRRAWASTSPSTPCGTASPPTCSRPAPTSGPSRSCSGTAASRPPPSTPTSRPPPCEATRSPLDRLAPLPGGAAAMTRPRLEVADVFRRHGDAFLDATATGSRPSSAAPCTTSPPAGPRPWAGTSRSATGAGTGRSPTTRAATATAPSARPPPPRDWMEAREAELLPVEYFHVVFTLPAALGPIALQNPRVVYGLLFRAAAETLQQVAADPEHLGAEIGFLAVLHTWGQNLQHHPHVHCVVPGGGLVARRLALGRLPAGLLPAGPRPQPRLPGQVPVAAPGRLRPRASSPSTASSARWPTRPSSNAGSPTAPGPSGSSTPSRPSAARSRC